MKIADARVIVTSPERNFVTLKIVTGEGVTGDIPVGCRRPRPVVRG